MISTPDGVEAAAGLKKAEHTQYSSTFPWRGMGCKLDQATQGLA